MEVMHRAVIKNRALKPLPGEITSTTINGATLPVKIEAGRRAIAACTDLPELLRYKSQAEGLSAAVRIMKDVGPEMIRAANEMMADAWRKGGELLSQYSGSALGKGTGAGKTAGLAKSPRRKIIDELGMHPRHASQMVRISQAPRVSVTKALERNSSLDTVGNAMPRVSTRGQYCNAEYSHGLKKILGLVVPGEPRQDGLNRALGALRSIPLDVFKQLQPDERKVVKAKITEIMELLDEMDRLCK